MPPTENERSQAYMIFFRFLMETRSLSEVLRWPSEILQQNL